MQTHPFIENVPTWGAKQSGTTKSPHQTLSNKPDLVLKRVIKDFTCTHTTDIASYISFLVAFYEHEIKFFFSIQEASKFTRKTPGTMGDTVSPSKRQNAKQKSPRKVLPQLTCG